MDDFSNYLHDQTGLSLSHYEVLRMYNQYFDEKKGKVDFNRLISDIRRGMQDSQQQKSSQQHGTFETRQNQEVSNKTFSSIVEGLRSALDLKMTNMVGKDRQKKAYYLLSQNHSRTVTLSQLRAACHSRLNFPISEAELQLLVKCLDKERNGHIDLCQLVALCLCQDSNSDAGGEDSVLPWHREQKQTQKLSHWQKEQQVIEENGTQKFRPYPPSGSGSRQMSFHHIQHQYAHKQQQHAQQYFSSNTSSEDAVEMYDGHITNLHAPAADCCRFYSVQELEDVVRERVVARSGRGSGTMAQAFLRLFGDGAARTDVHAGGGERRLLSRAQVQLAFWNRLRLNVSEADLDKFISKYATSSPTAAGSGSGGTGPAQVQVSLFGMMRGIMQARVQQESQPLLDDRHNAFDGAERARVAASLRHDRALELFVTSLRQHINAQVNRDSRAPHLLVHATQRMTARQTLAFLRDRLSFDAAALLPRSTLMRAFRHYSSSSSSSSSNLSCEAIGGTGMEGNGDPADIPGLLDVKRMVLEAMSLSLVENVKEGEGPLGEYEAIAQRPLLSGSIVAVTQLPGALRLTRMGPAQVEARLREKCFERQRNDHPHASLHKMFHDPAADSGAHIGGGRGKGAERVITRAGMRRVLQQWDIILAPEDFEAFFARHDRGDGVVDVRQFLRRLLPPAEPNANPFVPKHPQDAQQEARLAAVMRNITGRQREVDGLSGTQYSRLRPEFMSHVSGQQTEAAKEAQRYAQCAREAAAATTTHSNQGATTRTSSRGGVGDGRARTAPISSRASSASSRGGVVGSACGPPADSDAARASASSSFGTGERHEEDQFSDVLGRSLRSALRDLQLSAPASQQPPRPPATESTGVHHRRPASNSSSSNEPTATAPSALASSSESAAVALQQYRRHQAQLLRELANFYDKDAAPNALEVSATVALATNSANSATTTAATTTAANSATAGAGTGPTPAHSDGAPSPRMTAWQQQQQQQQQQFKQFKQQQFKQDDADASPRRPASAPPSRGARPPSHHRTHTHHHVQQQFKKQSSIITDTHSEPKIPPPQALTGYESTPRAGAFLNAAPAAATRPAGPPHPLEADPYTAPHWVELLRSQARAEAQRQLRRHSHKTRQGSGQGRSSGRNLQIKRQQQRRDKKKVRGGARNTCGSRPSSRVGSKGSSHSSKHKPTMSYSSAGATGTGDRQADVYWDAYGTARNSSTGWPTTATHSPRAAPRSVATSTAASSAAAATERGGEGAGEGQGMLASPRYVHTGQARRAYVDPLGVILQEQYRLSSGLTTISSQQYGLFVKNLARAVKRRERLVRKQLHTERQEQQQRAASAGVAEGRFDKGNSSEEEAETSFP